MGINTGSTGVRVTISTVSTAYYQTARTHLIFVNVSTFWTKASSISDGSSFILAKAAEVLLGG
jgi:hypothetical protein